MNSENWLKTGSPLSYLINTLSKEEPLFKILITVISNFLKENVEKEIQKDFLTMQSVFNSHSLQKRMSHHEFDIIFRKTKEIDKAFLKKMTSIPVSIDISCKEIEDIRKKKDNSYCKVYMLDLELL